MILSSVKGESGQMSKGYRVVEILRSIFVYLLAAGIIIGAVMFAMNQSPTKSFFGFRYYIVLTDSMKPALVTGDMVIVRLRNADAIHEGDIITFNPSSSNDAYLTHRVTEKIDNYENEQQAEITAVQKVTRDLRKAAKDMGEGTARYMVDAYYREQKERITADAIVR